MVAMAAEVAQRGLLNEISSRSQTKVLRQELPHCCQSDRQGWPQRTKRKGASLWEKQNIKVPLLRIVKNAQVLSFFSSLFWMSDHSVRVQNVTDIFGYKMADISLHIKPSLLYDTSNERYF